MFNFNGVLKSCTYTSPTTTFELKKVHDFNDALHLINSLACNYLHTHFMFTIIFQQLGSYGLGKLMILAWQKTGEIKAKI